MRSTAEMKGVVDWVD